MSPPGVTGAFFLVLPGVHSHQIGNQARQARGHAVIRFDGGDTRRDNGSIHYDGHGGTEEDHHHSRGNRITGFQRRWRACPACGHWRPTRNCPRQAGDYNIADCSGNRVRKVDRRGIISTIAGTGEAGFAGDDGPANNAKLHCPEGLATDNSGNLYIADIYNRRIRKADANGTISAFAGDGGYDYNGDNIPAVRASLSGLRGVATDRAGNIYITDACRLRVRKVDTNGEITTFAGTGEPGPLGDGGPATEASLPLPVGVASDDAGNVYISDIYDSRVRKVDTAGIITTVAVNGNWGFSGDGGKADKAQWRRRCVMMSPRALEACARRPDRLLEQQTGRGRWRVLVSSR
ncbi:hypothetical protein LWC34_09700 [Kibdelosporangium philippinense]|uniref:Teneurin NHL domain-containing protein n=1 Tax=Kibdelosporangium philippinense TaxID=211113 RepID=A0ABS8Z8H9_9PSEU|nr:hypothetical protein [Kibdelosporangium philippinense]MCE7003100.1 hypothetical protein [Kibdelosporangium philippinense]